MFSSSLRATLIAFVASAAVVSATPSLSVKVSGAEYVKGVEAFVITATIINTGNETLTILNEPHSPLSNIPANTFRISNSKGAAPKFTGIKVKYVPEAAIAAGKDAVTVLPPGQSVEVEHDLSQAYSFSNSGEGKYTVEANKIFYIVNSNNQTVRLEAAQQASTHAAKLTGRLAIARPEFKRGKFNGCSADQQKLLTTAASNAQGYVKSTLNYINSSKFRAATPRYTTWFGSYAAGRFATVKDHLKKMNSNNYGSYSFDCTCRRPGTFAYVQPDAFGTVYLCDAFWAAPPTGTDSQAGTIVHESSHFTKNGGTQDHNYGQTACKELATSRPEDAVNNADSHEYFVENNPSLN